MKSVAVLALAAGATAQVALYTSIAGGISKQIAALDSAIKAYTAGDGSEVIASASGLLSAVQSGSAAAAKGEPITDLGNALLLLPAYTGIAADVKGVVADLVSKKTLAFQNGLGATAEALLKSESVAALGLAGVITGKLQGGAEAGRPIASQTVIVPLTSAINSGIAAYASGPAATGGSSKASSAAASSSSAKASSSSAAASSSASESMTVTSASTSTETTVVAVSSTPAQFSGAAVPLQVGGGLAAAVGALAYIL